MSIAGYATQITDQLLGLIQLPSTLLKTAVLILAAIGLGVVVTFATKYLFELVRPLRRYAMYFPKFGVSLALRLNRWHWKRKHDPSANVYFNNIKHGSILQLSLRPLPAQLHKEHPLRLSVERLRDAFAKTALEENILVLPLEAEADGYYYQCTDRKVKPGEWAFKTEGCLWQEDTLITFTFLSHNTHLIDSAEVIAAMRSISVTRISPIAADIQKMLDSRNSV